jgi:RNA polymerase sigma factor (sigma-70 family)
MVQLQILNKILKTGSYDIVFDNDLTDGYFSEYPNEFEFIRNHYVRYGNVPDIETFIDKFNEFPLLEVAESDQYLIDKIENEEGDNNLDNIVLYNAIKELPSRERKIIILRYFRDKTQKEIANELGVSQVQVSRLENKILQKIKKMLD